MKSTDEEILGIKTRPAKIILPMPDRVWVADDMNEHFLHATVHDQTGDERYTEYIRADRIQDFIRDKSSEAQS